MRRAAETLPDQSCFNLDALRKTLLVDKLKQPSCYNTWHELVSFYSHCHLTVHSDELAAISGLASRFAVQWGIQSSSYLAGLWEGNLVNDFLWSTASWYGKSYPNRAPSWSWARVDGGIFYHTSQGQCQILVIAARTESGHDPFGRAPRGIILLQGLLCKVEATGTKWEPSFLELFGGFDVDINGDTVEVPAWAA